MGFVLQIYRNSHYSNLKIIAETYFRMGLSVIPTHANKIAAVNWKDFQTQLATPSDLRQWFAIECHPALGIICGTLSRLLVLDFDTEAQFTRFQSEYPELIHTLTVKTRRCQHLWYLLPENTHVASRKADGVDLLAEGKYAIAPPSTIDGYTYTFANNLPILEVTPEQIEQISTFVGGEIVEPEAGDWEMLPLSISELVGRYRKHAHYGNRNEALFRTALAARDAGWSQSEVMAVLVTEHVATATYNENPNQREREARRTIKSAFSRPPRRVEGQIPSALPNTIRETLCQLKLTCVIRVMEGLWRLGYAAGAVIHPETVWRELQSLDIGRHSIYKTLKATLEDGTPLFDRFEMVSPRTPSSEASAIELSPDKNKKCFLSEGKNRQKPHLGGRPPISYVLTGIPELFNRLGLKPSRTADTLPNTAYCSAKETRKAMGEALIRRSPGEYGRDLLAKRVGITMRTVDTYHLEFQAQYADFHKQHRFTEKPIFWNNLSEIPEAGTVHRGFFLMDDGGKKYPAKRSVAVMLLQHKKRVTLVRQCHNEYWFGPSFLPPSKIVERERLEAITRATHPPEQWREKAQAYWSTLNSPERQNSAQIGDFTASTDKHSVEGKKRLKKGKSVSGSDARAAHNPKRPFPYMEDEELVTRLQKRINQLCQSENQYISRSTLRQLIISYGKSEVRRALHTVEKRDNVDSPVGFLRTILKSRARVAELRQMSG